MKIIRLLSLLLLSVAAAVWAADGLETRKPTVLYDAPSAKAKARLILSGGHPIKQISKVNAWRKVITASGDTGWLAEADIQPARRVVVTTSRATVRVDPHPEASPVFYAQRGVVLETLQSRDNRWLQVLHEDGESGYIDAAAVWRND